MLSLPAISQDAQEEMEILCRGVEAICPLEETQNCIETIRVLRTEACGTYGYCGDWMIRHITKPAEDTASISLLGVFPDWS